MLELRAPEVLSASFFFSYNYRFLFRSSFKLFFKSDISKLSFYMMALLYLSILSTFSVAFFSICLEDVDYSVNLITYFLIFCKQLSRSCAAWVGSAICWLKILKYNSARHPSAFVQVRNESLMEALELFLSCRPISLCKP